MIFDSLNHIEAYKGIHPGVYKGLQFLRDTDFSKLAEGRYEVDGDDLFYSVQSYVTNPINLAPEAHRKYIDIQCVLEGVETIGVAPLEDMVEEVEARPDNDIWFYHGPTDVITLIPGRFVVLFPGDAHAPGVAAGVPAPCRKVVVKVKV